MNRNKPAIRRWVKALRSGEYEQTTGTLRSVHGYCCFGVACHISTKSKIAERPTKLCDYYSYEGPEGRVQENFLPYGMRKHYGLSDREQEELVKMNDAGKTFDEIADWIEENILDGVVESRSQ